MAVTDGHCFAADTTLRVICRFGLKGIPNRAD
jgi:hypothetical protein